MRALVVTNMYPSAERPAFGRFVFDQVQALQRLADVDVDVEVLRSGSLSAYAAAAPQLRRRFRGARFDVVHAHFGLSAWPALAVKAPVHAVTLHGTDLAHPRTRVITLGALRLMDLVGVASEDLGRAVPGWAVRGGSNVEVLPCGVDLERFHPLARSAARAALGLDASGRYLLLPADPARAEKRYDLAADLAALCGAELLVLRDVRPERVPLYVNAASAVVVPSDREGFGLGVLEALACNVPVLSTPHGVAAAALSGVKGTLCAPFSIDLWRGALAAHLVDPDPRVDGRTRASQWSADAMARQVAEAWRRTLATRAQL